MCLAQLSMGNEAVEFYKKGIELMLVEYERQESSAPEPTTSKSLKEDEDDEDEEDMNKIKKTDISTAFGSIAEIFLTDLWYFDLIFIP